MELFLTCLSNFPLSQKDEIKRRFNNVSQRGSGNIPLNISVWSGFCVFEDTIVLLDESKNQWLFQLVFIWSL